MKQSISSWGRIEKSVHDTISLNSSDTLPLKSSKKGLPYGNGRSYGDVCLNPNGFIWTTKNLDRFLSFDQKNGIISCEAGVLLRDIQRLIVPRGWILPVTPGTQLITVGGAIANDVHGKNHHIYGSFGDTIQSLCLLRTSGEVISCGPNENIEWFQSTIGGMGLTGVISQASIKLKKIEGPFLKKENISFNNIDDFFELADNSEKNWEHTVAWIDCLNTSGQGIFSRANHSDENKYPTELKRTFNMPFVPPVSIANSLSLRAFNWAYYKIQSLKKKSSIEHYESFFHPLDNISNWNRMYGPKGFYQHQCVIPRNVCKEAILEILKTISKSGEGSFLAVLKTFGNRDSIGMMSFPMHGATLALDFPNKGSKTKNLLKDLDLIISESGGRIYAAKDATMSAELFKKGYPQLDKFLKYRDSGIKSALSKRLIEEGI